MAMGSCIFFIVQPVTGITGGNCSVALVFYFAGAAAGAHRLWSSFHPDQPRE